MFRQATSSSTGSQQFVVSERNRVNVRVSSLQIQHFKVSLKIVQTSTVPLLSSSVVHS
jgi:hypothetical protein